MDSSGLEFIIEGMAPPLLAENGKRAADAADIDALGTALPPLQLQFSGEYDEHHCCL